MPDAVPVAEGLFTWQPDGPRLLGTTCRRCGTSTFPAQQSCPRCCAEDMEVRPLPRSGTLWSFTVQGFRPKPPYDGPEPFEPYGVGYVDLAGEVIVESRLTVNDPDQLDIGMPVELMIVPFRRDAEDRDVVTFAFAPSSSEATP